ncbi:hypothetical protein PPL_02141 [Heterostelium album PN500]|uniref:PPPDE domain-containing protein n=1 Tax=Heterostelium pallidum (strain ATCC 26659 / Pp 5 / PN500) TaxID=670386 RepID=D3B1G8_HETP5|nr:hypothetical protein PPL_02141 [Heterostelium album PN500]EFA85142.1 hypothetical protein PPL_02141 [Heterostelium album PN500]|eukprot:XP_020437251.1 hypothetical protein PPL_02141 [Heterostelium album PN500]
MNIKKKEVTPEKIYLNVYDLHPVNSYFYYFGLGAFHSGVELYGSEYSFGGHEYSFTGVFEIEPRTATGVIFRERLLIGETTKSRSQVQSIVDAISDEFTGNSYHPLQRNCNSFSQEFVYRLTGKNIPNYINRLAYIGNFFSCLIPNLSLNTPSASSQQQQQQQQRIGGTGSPSSGSSGSNNSSNINSPHFPGQGYTLSNLPTPPPLELSSDDDDDEDDETSTLKRSTSSSEKESSLSMSLSSSSSNSSDNSSNSSGNSELEERRKKMLLAASKRQHQDDKEKLLTSPTSLSSSLSSTNQNS